MKPLVKALSLVLLSLPLLAHAGSKSATMQVSFTVTDACIVQAGARADAKAPVVACQLNTPLLITRNAAAPAAGSAASALVNTNSSSAIARPATAQEWTVYF